MKIRLSLFAAAAVVLANASAIAGDFSFTEFNSDANSYINTGWTYTAKADFAGSGPHTVNSVVFSDLGFTGTGYALTGPPNALASGTNVGGQMGQMVNNFYYGGAGARNATLTLTGLTAGQTYVSSWYNRSYGTVGGRNVNITPADTNVPFLFNEDFNTTGRGNILRYTFTATSDTMTYNFAAVNDDTFHHYAFSNAVARTDIVLPRIFQAEGAGPLTAFASQVKANDLLQTSVATVTSGGNFNQESAGGIPVLTNGTFVLKGGNVSTPGNELANSELATVAAGAFLQYDFNITANTLGYDVALIQLFGGWNDQGRDQQFYKVLYLVVGSSLFTEVGSVNFNGQPVSTTLPPAITASFDTRLTGVDGIRVEFQAGVENGYAGLGEIDVVGVATVPEPASALLALLAGGALISRRRRK